VSVKSVKSTVVTYHSLGIRHFVDQWNEPDSSGINTENLKQDMAEAGKKSSNQWKINMQSGMTHPIA